RTPRTAAFANKQPIFFLPFVAVDAEAYAATQIVELGGEGHAPFQRSAVSAERFQFEEERSAPPGADARSDTQNCHPRQGSLDQRHCHRGDHAPHNSPDHRRSGSRSRRWWEERRWLRWARRSQRWGLRWPRWGFGFCRRRAYRRSRNWIARNQPFLRAVLYGVTGRRRNGALFCQSPCRHARSRTRSNTWQSRHHQRSIATAFRVRPIPGPLPWIALAVVVGRPDHRLDRACVLAVRLLRFLRLRVLAVCLRRLLALCLRRRLLRHLRSVRLRRARRPNCCRSWREHSRSQRQHGRAASESERLRGA